MAILDELQQLADLMHAEPEAIRSLNAVYQFNLGDSEIYQVKFREGNVEVIDGDALTADCTLTLSADNLRKLLKDELNTTMAFMMRTLKVDGKVGLALKLQEILKSYTS
ncbi:SCP2 sterol-binding domain-containing protein [Paenibacillus marinisediminis]